MKANGSGVVRRLLLAALAALAVAGGLFWVLRGGSSHRIVAPRPEEREDDPVVLEPGASVLTVPIRIDLEPLVAEMEEAVPRTWGGLDRRLDAPENERVSLAVALRRGPFRASFQGSGVRVSSLIEYRLRVWYDLPVLPEVGASCGTGEEEDPPRLVASLEGPLTLTRDWRLSSKTRVAAVRPGSDEERDRCRITLVRVDVTDRVVEAAESFLMEQRRAIDSLVARADVRSSFESWWSVLRDPIRLDEGIWLMLRPEAIRRGPVRGKGDLVEVTASLLARPRVILGHRPIPPLTPLPPLEEGTLPGGLEILAEGTAQYDAIGRRVSAGLAGETLERSGRRLRIEEVRFSGIGGGRVALEVEVGGDLDGRLFLVGTPAYDPASGYASVPDLEFTVETSNLFVTGTSWIAEAGLVALLRRRARWPVSPAVDWVQEKLHEGLNRELTEGVRLSGTVEEVEILGVIARKYALVVRAAAKAEAVLLVEASAGD